jgi:hypothetical protein
MARRVFFSFHYEEDISTSMIVRNSWVTKGKETAGFVDRAEFEKVKKQGDRAVYNWIDKQLEGTSVTVVLIGKETLNRKFVQYEIIKSIKRGNAIIGVYIHRLKGFKPNYNVDKCNKHTIIGKHSNGNPIYFDNICDGIYDYKLNNGYDNLGKWIARATLKRRNE